jgi:hypothetical protein
MRQALFALLILSSIHAFAGEAFICDFEIAACSLADKTSFKCDAQKLLLNQKKDLICPSKAITEVAVLEFGLNKAIQLHANCGADQMLQLVALEQLSGTVARTIGTTMVPASLGAANLFSVLAKDSGPFGENRVLMNIICIKKKSI